MIVGCQLLVYLMSIKQKYIISLVLLISWPLQKNKTNDSVGEEYRMKGSILYSTFIVLFIVQTLSLKLKTESIAATFLNVFYLYFKCFSWIFLFVLANSHIILQVVAVIAGIQFCIWQFQYCYRVIYFKLYNKNTSKFHIHIVYAAIVFILVEILNSSKCYPILCLVFLYHLL